MAIFGWVDAREIWRDLIDYRELLWQMTVRDLRVRYKQAIMGFAWAIFMPALLVFSGMILRAALAFGAGERLNPDDVAPLIVKVIGWSFFSGALMFATTSMTSNANLVSKIYFPREVFPLSAVLTQIVDSSIAAAVGIVALLVLGGIVFGPQLLWVGLLAVIMLAFTTALALLLSSANLFFRDVKYIVQVIPTFGAFASPVYFEPALLGPVWGRLMMWNPVAPLLEGLRLSVCEGHNLATPLIETAATGVSVVAWLPGDLAYSATVAAVLLAIAAIVFHRLEFVYAEYV